MRQLPDWQREAADPGEFLESLRYDLAVRDFRVYLYDVVNRFDAGGLAYAVHTGGGPLPQPAPE